MDLVFPRCSLSLTVCDANVGSDPARRCWYSSLLWSGGACCAPRPAGLLGTPPWPGVPLVTSGVRLCFCRSWRGGVLLRNGYLRSLNCVCIRAVLTNDREMGLRVEEPFGRWQLFTLTASQKQH